MLCLFVRINTQFNRPSKLDWSRWIIARQIRHLRDVFEGCVWGMCFLPFVYTYFIHDEKFRCRISETVPNSSRTPLARPFVNLDNRSGILTNMSRISTIISKTPVNIFGIPKNIFRTPKNIFGTPKNISGTPKNNSGYPAHSSGYPAHSSGSPKNSSGTPRTPTNSYGTPTNQSRNLDEQVRIDIISDLNINR